MTSRPSFDETFFEIARAMSERATCNRAHHGAVIVKDNQILATGYNGSEPGEPHCVDVGCQLEYTTDRPNDLLPRYDTHCVRTIHAEENAILQAARVGVSLLGATLYVTGDPCYKCMKSIIRSGIGHVKISGNHPHPSRWDEVKGEHYARARVRVSKL